MPINMLYENIMINPDSKLFACRVYQFLEEQKSIDGRYSYCSKDRSNQMFMELNAELQGTEYSHAASTGISLQILQALCRMMGKKCCDFFLPISKSDKINLIWNAFMIAANINDWPLGGHDHAIAKRIQNVLNTLFRKTAITQITEDDVLEFGLYGCIDSAPRSASQLILRHHNLKKIYAGEVQNNYRWERSLPDIITDTAHYPAHPTALLQSELCAINYVVTIQLIEELSVKSCQITQAKKTNIANADAECLILLQATLTEYKYGRKLFRFSFGSIRSSDESKALYQSLTDILQSEKTDNTKITEIAKTIVAATEKLDKSEQSKRRLFRLLADAGFTNSDFLGIATVIPHSAAAASSGPN